MSARRLTQRYLVWPLLLGLFKMLGRRIPIYDVPPRRNVIRPLVLILQIIRMLPNVEPEHRLRLQRNRRVLVRRRVDRQLSILHDKPCPARTKSSGASRGKLRLEFIERSERRFNRVAQRALRLAASALLHLRPEERVIPVSAGVVAH